MVSTFVDARVRDANFRKDDLMSDLSNGQIAAVAPTRPSNQLHLLLDPPACPSCGRWMRLARIVPLPGTGPKADEITYDCACGHSEIETVEAS
jgi:hypothetical protein